MNKKRRTELDIDPTAIPYKEEEEAAPAKEPEAPEEKKPPEEKAPPPPAQSKPRRKINYFKLLTLALVGGALIILAVAIGFGVTALVTSFLQEPEQVEEKEPPPPPLTLPIPEPSTVKKDEKADIPAPPLYELKPFFLTKGEGKDKSFVRVGFAAEMTGAEVSKEIERNLVLIRENIYFLLQEKSLDSFENEEKRKRLAVEVAIALNRSIQSGAVNKVLITSLTIE